MTYLAFSIQSQRKAALLILALMYAFRFRPHTSGFGFQVLIISYLGILALIFTSCTLIPPFRPTVIIIKSPVSEVPTVEELLAPLRLRQQQLTSLRGLARVTYKDGEEKSTAKQAVAVAAPDHLRVELFSPIGIAALMTTDGQRLAAYFPREKTIYRGVASAENAARFLRIMLSANEIVNLLLGLPLSMPQEEAGVVRFDAAHDWYVLSLPDAGGGSQTLSFDARKLHLLKWETLNDEGTVLARMVMAEYRTVHDHEFPFEIVLTDLQGKQEAGIYYERVEIAPALADTLFTLAPIAGVQEIDLDAPAP